MRYGGSRARLRSTFEQNRDAIANAVRLRCVAESVTAANLRLRDEIRSQ